MDDKELKEKIEEKLKEKEKETVVPRKESKRSNIESYKRQISGNETDVDDEEPRRLLKGLRKLLKDKVVEKMKKNENIKDERKTSEKYKRRIPIGRSPRNRNDKYFSERKQVNDGKYEEENINISEAPL